MSTTTTAQAIETGTVFVSRWGYEQTNVDFFVVTRATAKSVWLRPVRSVKVTENARAMRSTVLPLTAAPTGAEFRRKIQDDHGRPWVSLNSFSVARVWDGQREHATAYA